MTDTLLIDCAWTKPAPHAVKAAGYVGVIGYISHDNTGKDMSAAQAKAYRKAGLFVGFVFETTAGEAKRGRAAGVGDRVFAESQAKARGYPTGCVIFYAVDFDATPKATEVLPYFGGVGAGDAYPSGVYGEDDVVEAVLAAGKVRYGWQTVAWSQGELNKHAHLFQRNTRTHAIKGVKSSGYDEDVLLKPLPLWGGTIAPEPVKPPVVKPAAKATRLAVPTRAALRLVIRHLNKRTHAVATADRALLTKVQLSAQSALGVKAKD